MPIKDFKPVVCFGEIPEEYKNKIKKIGPLSIDTFFIDTSYNKKNISEDFKIRSLSEGKQRLKTKSLQVLAKIERGIRKYLPFRKADLILLEEPVMKISQEDMADYVDSTQPNWHTQIDVSTNGMAYRIKS